MKSSSGYTLIEILATLSIISILLSLSFPQLKTLLDSAKDAMLRNQLLTSISTARMEAYAKHLPVTLCKSRDFQSCNGNWEDGELIFQNTEKDGVLHDASQIIRIVQPPFRHGRLFWRAFPSYRHYLLFSPNAFMTTDNGTFWHCHKEAVQWAIRLSKTGLTHIIYPDNDGMIKDGHGQPLVCQR